MESPIPDKIELLEERGNLVIRRKWFGPQAIMLTLFCVIWDGFLVFWYMGAMQAEGTLPLMHVLFPIGHVVVGVGITYFTIACYLNKTDIIISPMQLVVRIQPMKWPGEGRYYISDIKQLYTYKKVRKTKNGTSITYEVRFIDKHDNQKTLVKGLQTKEQGLYIEKEIENVIGLEDQAVPGEV